MATANFGARVAMRGTNLQTSDAKASADRGASMGTHPQWERAWERAGSACCNHTFTRAKRRLRSCEREATTVSSDGNV